MADLSDVQRIALSLPETTMEDDHIAFSVNNKGKRKGIAWVWMERVHPKQARVPNLSVLAIRVRDLAEKDMLLAARPSTLFTEPHYNGFPAVLVRRAAIDVDELVGLIRTAGRCQAPAALVRSFDERRGLYYSP
jgi:hypothetical protein